MVFLFVVVRIRKLQSYVQCPVIVPLAPYPYVEHREMIAMYLVRNGSFGKILAGAAGQAPTDLVSLFINKRETMLTG